MNAKSQLFEMLKNLGCKEDCVVFTPHPSPTEEHQSTVIVSFPNGLVVQATGTGHRRAHADIAAARCVLNLLHSCHPHLFPDWEEINSEAQAGDALIKLAAYLSVKQKNASGKSLLLQRLEADSHLAKVFDIWRSQDDPDLAMWGTDLGEKRKATLIEALLWRRFGAQVIASTAQEHLHSLLELLVVEHPIPKIVRETFT